MRARAQKGFLSLLLSRMRIRWADFRKAPVILVYQMGKVGSSSVTNSLRKAQLPYPVYQVHFLSPEGIRKAENEIREQGRPGIPYHLRLAKAIGSEIAKCSRVKWKLVSLVREPVSRSISDIFENLSSRYSDFLRDDQSLNEAQIADLLRRKFVEFYDEETDYVCTWFDNEIKQVFHLDVYEYPFDREKGWTILRNEYCELLILRLEDLPKNFEQCFATFLNTQIPIRLYNSNITANKKLAESYRKVTEKFKLPVRTCEELYSSRYVRHFYPDQMIKKFIAQWSGCR